MLTGALAVSAMQTNQHLGLPTGFITSPTPTAELLKFASAILTASVALLAGVAFTANAVKAKSSPPAATWLDLFFEFASGTLFALGLGISGMTRPSKVSGFLAVFSNAFDPSLMFVMGGALLVALPGYQLVLRSGIIKQPLCAVEFKIPGKSDIDARLLVGAALFGAGWGTAGICPGPGIVALATQQTPIYVFVVSVIAGMMLSSRIEGLQMVKQP